jgi:hypothetical protein
MIPDSPIDPVDARVAEIIANLENDICNTCGAKVERKRQVSCCVYGEPCGHRLYHGRLPETPENEYDEFGMQSLFGGTEDAR